MRALRVGVDPVRRDALIRESRVKRVVERDDHKIFNAQALDPVDELVNPRRVRVRDRRENLPVDRGLT